MNMHAKLQAIIFKIEWLFWKKNDQCSAQAISWCSRGFHIFIFYPIWAEKKMF